MITDKLSKGDISESVVSSELLRRGYVVSRPLATCSYDLVAEIDGELKKIQVKSAFAKENSYGSKAYYANLTKTGRTYDNGEKSNKSEYYTSDEVDIFAIYVLDCNEVFIFSFDEAPNSGIKRVVDSWYKNHIDQKL